MDYLTAWQEGYTSGQEFALKLVNQELKLDFKKVSEMILYMEKLEALIEELRARVEEMENFYD
jgi:flagellar biosynthesis/type III secretory pathway protein FliH